MFTDTYVSGDIIQYIWTVVKQSIFVWFASMFSCLPFHYFDSVQDVRDIRWYCVLYTSPQHPLLWSVNCEVPRENLYHMISLVRCYIRR